MRYIHLRIILPREADGIYRIKQPEFGDTDAYSHAVNRVKVTHENGDETGSSGWGYKYSLQEARRLILRGTWNMP